jgi:hypothetical protein
MNKMLCRVFQSICLMLCFGISSSFVMSQIIVLGEGGKKSVKTADGCLSAGSGPSTTQPAARLQPTTVHNQRLLLEEQEWQQRLGVNAAIFVISADNAFAEPGGRVLLGQQLANRYLQKGDDYALQALAYVTAHEFGHHLQFRFNQYLPGPAAELQADAIAGYWAGMRLAEQVRQGLPIYQAKLIMGIERNSAYEIGDYVFNSPQHHGTPTQRHNAVLEGLRAGYSLRYGSNFRSSADAARLLEGMRQIVSGILR